MRSKDSNKYKELIEELKNTTTSTKYTEITVQIVMPVDITEFMISDPQLTKEQKNQYNAEMTELLLLGISNAFTRPPKAKTWNTPDDWD